MAEKVLSMYLAGSIRDDRPEDIEWREQVIQALPSVRIMNPLGGKTKDAAGNWTVSGMPSGAKFITKHDKWYVENSDMCCSTSVRSRRATPTSARWSSSGWPSHSES
jgi:hypothetical protein